MARGGQLGVTAPTSPSMLATIGKWVVYVLVFLVAGYLVWRVFFKCPVMTVKKEGFTGGCGCDKKTAKPDWRPFATWGL